MTFASGATASLAYVAETVYNTTPTTPQLIQLPYTSTSLDLTRAEITDPSIVGDRMERGVKSGTQKVAGNIAVVYRHDEFDDLIEAAFGGTWTANVLKVGGTNGGLPRSFTIEQGFTDISQYLKFTGVRVNTFGVSGKVDAYADATFGLMGAGYGSSTTPSDATPTVPGSLPGLSLLGGSVTIGGVAQKLTTFNLELNNNMEGVYGATATTAYDVHWANAIVTGSVTAFFESMTEYNHFLADTTAEIVAVFTDGTNTHTYTLPAAKYTTAGLPVSGPGLLFITFSFKGIYDATLGSTMSITRSA
jgi:hypothetical protein